MDPRKCIQTILLCCIVISTLSGLFVCAQRNIHIQDGDQNTNTLTYTRKFLLSLRHQPLSMTVPNINIDFDETKRKKKKKRREGPGEEFETDYVEEVQGCLCPL